MSDIFSTQNIFFMLLLSFFTGAVGSLVFRNNDRFANLWNCSFAVAGSILGLAASISSLFLSRTFNCEILTSFPNLILSFNFDRLASFFVFILSVVVLFASIYSLGYVKHFYGKYNIGKLGFFYNAFILSMMLVFVSANALFFMIVWEFMALASYVLVIYERKEENIKAGFLYFVMTHISTVFIVMMFLLLYAKTGSFDFAVISDSFSGLSAGVKNLVFIFGLIGFGIKAGIIPLHIWLPSAHPAAPSHVSAILSGVMIKAGIYMLIRLMFDFSANIPLWWGIAVLAIGAVSSLLGVLYALAEHDIKRLLAYSSIENIGIIFLGIGGSLVFISIGFMPLASAALAAAMFHTLNHANFKALLFLCAGSVVSVTHTRNIEEYGGLIKRMPQTALFFLIGSMAISALPPFNGFFSEWLTFQTLFYGFYSLNTAAQWAFVVASGALAFTGGLAIACFVKAFGVTFLARPRSEESNHAKEVSLPMQIGMGGLAVLTLVFGIFAGTICRVLRKVAVSVNILRQSGSAIETGIQTVNFQNGFSSISMPVIFYSLIFSLIAVSAVIYALTKKQKINRDITWNCGTDTTARMEITSTAFSRSIITIFSGILKSSKQHDIEYHDAEMRYFSKYSAVTMTTKDIYKEYLYNPAHSLISRLSEYSKNIQTGNVNIYILYIFITLFGLLIMLNF